MEITTTTKIKDIWAIPELTPAVPYFIGGSKEWYDIMEKGDFLTINKQSPTWNPDAMVFGVRRLLEVAKSGKQYIYDVYTESETASDERKKMVKLFHFPGEQGKPFAVVCAGGGFGAVASIAEAFPVAARLNELGYNVFCLNYRTGDMVTQYFDMVGKALDDFAAALIFIFNNSKKFALDSSNYAVCGFSAGGHLCAQWSNPLVGYKAHGLPKPKVLFLGYGIIIGDFFTDEKIRKLWELMSMVMYGLGHTPEYAELHNIAKNADKDFPPTYILQAKDDDLVPAPSAYKLAERLNQQGITHKSKIINTGGHGFGLGTSTEAEGWLDEAVAFWEEL